MIEILKLQHLFERDLEIVYDCERRLVKEFAEIIDVVSSVQLQSVFKNDRQEALTHLERLNRIFIFLNRSPAEEPDHALKSIFHESKKLIKIIDPSALLDSALIIFGNQIHHHKIAFYGSLWSLAQALGFKEAVDSLEQAMNDEKAAYETLMDIGLRWVNPDAVNVQNPPHGWVIV